MNEILKSLYRDDNEIAKWCSKVPRESYLMSKREDKLHNELESTLDESQKLLLEKLLDLHIKNYIDHGEEAFIAGARTAARLIIEMLTDD